MLIGVMYIGLVQFAPSPITTTDFQTTISNWTWQTAENFRFYLLFRPLPRYSYHFHFLYIYINIYTYLRPQQHRYISYFQYDTRPLYTISLTFTFNHSLCVVLLGSGQRCRYITKHQNYSIKINLVLCRTQYNIVSQKGIQTMQDVLFCSHFKYSVSFGLFSQSIEQSSSSNSKGRQPTHAGV